MRFWWVNQNQTWRQEVGGGYLWSPKRKANNQLNPFYESMREVSPGDVILSFRDTLIAAIGIAYSHCYECLKPQEFGEAGRNWGAIGWKIDVVLSTWCIRFGPRTISASFVVICRASTHHYPRQATAVSRSI